MSLKKILILVLMVGTALLHWAVDRVETTPLLFEVPYFFRVLFFETRYLYLYLHLFALIGVVPLSFDKKVTFFKSWTPLFKAILVMSVIFWLWDMAKTAVGVWGFNPRYYTFLLINLPIEEWFFFLTFPFASVFIYECLNAYFPKNTFFNRIEPYLTYFFIIFFLVVGLWNWGKMYTATTFLPAGFFLLYHRLFIADTYRGCFYRALLVTLIPFTIVNGILTGIATEQPVVVYNPDEYLGIRFLTIPVDDSAYLFLMMLLTYTFYHYFKGTSQKTALQRV